MGKHFKLENAASHCDVHCQDLVFSGRGAAISAKFLSELVSYRLAEQKKTKKKKAQNKTMALLHVALALHNLSNKAAICSSMDLYSWKVWCTKSAKRMGQSRDTSSALVWTANAEVKTCVVNCAAALWMLWEWGRGIQLLNLMQST